MTNSIRYTGSNYENNLPIAGISDGQCGIHALHFATGKSRISIYNELKRVATSLGVDSVNFFQSESVLHSFLESYGFTRIDLSELQKARGRKRFTTRYMIGTGSTDFVALHNNHIATIRDGVLRDWNSSDKHIKAVYIRTSYGTSK